MNWDVSQYARVSLIVDEQGVESGFKVEFGLNGQFLIMRGSSGEMTDEQKKQIKDASKEMTKASDEDIERFLSMPYKSLQIRIIDPKTSEVIEYLFDSQRCIAQGRGRRQRNKETIEWKWSATAQGATSVSIIEKINDNKFTYNHKYTLPNGNKIEDKILTTTSERCMHGAMRRQPSPGGHRTLRDCSL